MEQPASPTVCEEPFLILCSDSVQRLRVEILSRRFCLEAAAVVLPPDRETPACSTLEERPFRAALESSKTGL
jgi:hypothetical protein